MTVYHIYFYPRCNGSNGPVRVFRMMALRNVKCENFNAICCKMWLYKWRVQSIKEIRIEFWPILVYFCLILLHLLLWAALLSKSKMVGMHWHSIAISHEATFSNECSLDKTCKLLLINDFHATIFVMFSYLRLIFQFLTRITEGPGFHFWCRFAIKERCLIGQF